VSYAQSSLLLTKIPYLKGIIELNAKETQCKCLLCTSNQRANRNGNKKEIVFSRKGLKNHLDSKSHRAWTNSEDIERLEKPIEALSKVPNLQNETKDSNEDAEYIQNTVEVVYMFMPNAFPIRHFIFLKQRF